VPAIGIAAGAVAAFLVLVGLLMGVSGKLGIASIADDQVAVKVNYVTGNSEVVTTPGFQLYVPFITEVFLFDKSPQKFLMEGGRVIDEHTVPLLTVRAADGSNFRFDTLEIQYRMIPGDAAKVLDDSGPGDSFKGRWIKAYARSILRDEFGRYSAEEVANPTTYGAATATSKDRLNGLLRLHGIEVVQIVTPKPRFDDIYEKAIEDRKVADQDVERLIAMEDQLMREREQHLARVQKDKEIEMRSLRGDLERLRIESERDAIRITKAADAYAIEQRAHGAAEQAQMVAEARGLTAKYTKEAEGLVAKANALEERGEVIVREALIQKLQNIRFTLLPYSRDSAPRRLEHVEQGTASRATRVDLDQTNAERGGSQ
jgi:membrane protease subunit HflC